MTGFMTIDRDDMKMTIMEENPSCGKKTWEEFLYDLTRAQSAQ